MGAIALSPVGRMTRFYEATIGKKAVMAVTGVVLFGYVVGHMLGNLQIFLGPAQLNRYAELLHSAPALLWAVRLLLLAAVGLHVTASLQLWWLRRQARPVRYQKKDDVGGNYASRTMMWSGPILAAFVVFHVLHLTTGGVPGLPMEAGNVYNNVVRGFLHPAVSLAYIVAVSMLMLHMYHGLWSMFQTVGASHPRYTPLLKSLAKIVAVVLLFGYISIPVAVMAGILTPQ